MKLGKRLSELLLLAVQPIINFIKKNPEKNWDVVVKDFGRYSTGQFFKVPSLSI